MLLTIHDANLRKVAFIDNNKQDTLNYFSDTWTRYLETGSSTFNFTVFKKAVISDSGQKKAYNYLNEKAFVSFVYKGKTYLHTIRKVEENEQTIKCYGINFNFELINEYANPYKSPKAMSFVEYCKAMGIDFALLKIGVNEVSDQRISAEWEGSDTKLNRLLSLATKFSAELEFETFLNADSSIKSFVVNVYHENDDTHQGVGRVTSTILKYGKNLKSLTRTIDKTEIYNMVRPTGKTENGDVVTIRVLGAWSVDNDKGEREFYQAGEALYAPLSMQMYPAVFTSDTTGDQWIRKDMTVDSANPEVIRSTAYRELKKNCYPAVTYETEGFADLDIGDTVQVYDNSFYPTLLLQMRVSEQVVSFTNPNNNKTTFANAKALENKVSSGIQGRLDKMIEEAQSYSIKLTTDNGVVFKNSEGETTVFPMLLKGNKEVACSWRWLVNGEPASVDDTYTVKAADVAERYILSVAAMIDGAAVAEEQVTFTNINEGGIQYFEQETEPQNVGENAFWKYTGTDNLTVNQTTILPNTSYRWTGEAWDKMETNSTNLNIEDGFVQNDMISTGAISADKLNVGSLSAVSADLGDVKSGTITNTFSTPYSSGTIKLADNIQIETKNTSAALAHKALTTTTITSDGFIMTAKRSDGTNNYTMNVSPDIISFQKMNYNKELGGTGKWDLYFSGAYSILNIDVILQKVRLSNSSYLPYGVLANYVRIGNFVTISVNRQVKAIASATENGKATETIPEGFRPISQCHLTLMGNSGSTIDATCIVHLNPDGTIYFTNNKTNSHVWSGTVTYTTVDEFPLLSDLSNGSTL